MERSIHGNFIWKLNLDVIEKAANEIGSELDPESNFDGQTLFIAGGNSDYILEADHETIKRLFPQAKVVTIQGAGHWVHAEQPKVFYSEVINYLNA